VKASPSGTPWPHLRRVHGLRGRPCPHVRARWRRSLPVGALPGGEFRVLGGAPGGRQARGL